MMLNKNYQNEIISVQFLIKIIKKVKKNNEFIRGDHSEIYKIIP